MLPVIAIVPATVPVTSINGDGNMALVVFAGIVNVTVLPPVENCTAGSSTGRTAVDEYARFSVPLSSAGDGAGIDKTRGSCCAGATVSCKPVREIVPRGGPMTKLKLR